MSEDRMDAPAPSGLIEVDQTIDKALALAESATGRIGKVVALANATKAVGLAVASNWDSIKGLKDSPLGFLTDEAGRKNDFRYSDAALQTAITHGILLGGLPFNGEITVLSGRAYLGKTHYRRLVSECERITNLSLQFGAITMQGEGRALVEALVTWDLDGERKTLSLTRANDLDRRVPVRVNAGMGDDGIMGKAERKILRRVWEISTGRQAAGEDEDDARTVDASATPAAATPSTEELRTEFAAFVERIKAAATVEAVRAIHDEFTGPKFGPHWAPSALERFQQWVDSRLAKLEPRQESGNEPTETPKQAFDRYETRLAECQTVKECANLFSAFFGDRSPHKWNDEDQGIANEMRAKRVDAIRGMSE